MIGRWLRRTLTVLLALAVVGGLAAWVWAQRVLPQTDGMLALAGAGAGGSAHRGTALVVPR